MKKLYEDAYKRYVKDNLEKQVIYSYEGFCDNVGMHGDSITYKKYFKDYLRQQKLKRVLYE